MQSIGERLEEARKRRGISLREAAEATKIRADFLQNFENNQYEISVPDLYVRGFLRNYANYLKINADKIVGDYTAMTAGAPEPGREKARELFGRIELGTPIDEPVAVSTPSNGPAGVNAPGGGVGMSPLMEALQRNRVKLAVLAVGAVGVLVLILVLVNLLLGGGERPSAPSSGGATPAQSAPAQPAQEIVLIARDTVDVEVFARADGAVLFRGTLRRGTRQPLQITGQVRITTPTGRNLEVEAGGVVYRMPGQDYSNALFPIQ